MENIIKNEIQNSIDVKKALIECDRCIHQIKLATKMVIDAYKSGKKTLLAGNGGSAADSQHIAGEFVSRFYFDRPGLASIALTTDTSILTAIGNDYGYNNLFARQIQALGNEGDVFIAISTSGNSKNIVEALSICKEKGIKTIGFSGEKIGEMDKFCDINIKVPSTITPRIQEAHITIGHIICGLTESELFNDLNPNK
jgi:D-sedoheptulose 7-phosphate isomerase|tara:strand:- start:192 stop:785 length:594 start_codon:yes stop_codon:yes gene_type:complete